MGFAGIGRAEDGFQIGHMGQFSEEGFAGRLGFRAAFGTIYVRVLQISILIFNFKLPNPLR